MLITPFGATEIVAGTVVSSAVFRLIVLVAEPFTFAIGISISSSPLYPTCMLLTKYFSFVASKPFVTSSTIGF